MKRKLFLLLCALLTMIGVQAREDVTSQYLTDAALENEAKNWALVSTGGNHAWNGTYKYHESWHNTFTISQTTAELPAGYYQLSIQAAVEGGNSTTISLQATSGSNSSIPVYPKYSTHSSYGDMAAWWGTDANHTNNRNLNRIFTTVYVEEGQKLTATFKQTNGGQWFVYGQMQLHRLTNEEGRRAQYFEAAYNSKTNLDMTTGRFKQRFEDYTAGTVEGKKLVKTIPGLPLGYYNVTLNGGASYTSGRGFEGNTGDNLTVFYANNASTNVTVVDRTGIGNEQFTDYTASNATVTNGDLEVGYNNLAIGANWFVGSVKYIEYLGGCVEVDAIALPDGGAMTADTWYYFDIPVAGDEYNATATTLGDIICTANGNQLSSSATGEITLKATDNSFAVGRYYVKSSSANKLVVASASYSYEVSEASADKAYIQAGQTITVNFVAGTNDPTAELTQNYNGVTFDGAAINVTPGASGFTFTAPANLLAGAPHTLYIPAGAIGYEVGSTFNAEQSIVLNATAIYDGIYYFKVENETAAKGKYLSRGNTNGVHATIDFYGIPVQVVTNGNNETTLQAYDSKQYYVHVDKWDCNANGETSANGLYTITLNGGKYRIHNNSMEAGCYFKYNDNALGNVVLDVYDDGTGSNSGPIIDWSIETLSEHNAVLGTYTAKNYTNVIEDAGLTVKADEFVEYLASNYAAKDKTSSVGTAKITNAAGSWTWTGVREQGGQPAYNNAAEAWQATGSWSQTIENLPSGIYKVTVNAFERDGGWALCNTLGAEGYEIVTSYFKANDEQVQLKSWYSEKTGTNNPNSMGEASTAFNNDKYKNEVYTYVADGGSGTGSLTITIAKPGFIGDNWLLFNNVSLTYYDSSVSPEDATAILEEATTAMNSPMKPSLYQALASAKSAFEGSQTVPNYNALRTAIDNCATSIASYAAMNTNYLERIESLLASTNVYKTTTEEYVKYTDYKSRYENYKTDDSEKDIENATANALNAYAGDKGTRPVDLVLMPSWTIGGEATGNKFYQNTWSAEGAGDGTNFLLPFYEYWVPGEQVLNATTLQATQTGLTAKGIYKVSAWVRVQESTAGAKIDNGITMQVGEGPSVDVSAGEKIGETNRYIGEYTAYGQADNDGNLVIKFVVAEGSNISWLAFKNLNYEVVPATYSANLKVADGKLGTFIAPFDVTLPDNVKAYSATVVNNEVKLSKIDNDKLDAGTPVIVYGDGVSVDQTFYGVPTVEENKTEGNLVGILNESEKEVPAGAYVLQTQTGGQAFYKVATAAPGALNRCYLTTSEPSSGARLTIIFDGEDPTAINAIEAAEAEDGALKDGKYLIDGKIVIVKNGVKYSANGQILK